MAAEFGLSAISTRAGPSGSTVAATAGERHRKHEASARPFDSPSARASYGKIAPVRGDIKMTALMTPEAIRSRVCGLETVGGHGP